MRIRTGATAIAAVARGLAAPQAARAHDVDLWQVYDQALKGATYIDLTHTLTPGQPVWKGFGPSVFSPSVDPATGMPYTYAKDGFEATAYTLSTDQFGTQFDPPAHWAPEQAAIDEIPATYSVRPLVVIDITEQVAKDPSYFLSVADVQA